MSTIPGNVVADLLKREPATLVAATGIFFDALGKRHPRPDIKAVLDSHRGGVWGDEAPEGRGYPVLRSTNMRGSKADVADAAWRQIPASQAAGCALQTGDILVTKSSGSSDLVGKSVLFRHPGNGQTYLFSNFTLRLRPNADLIDANYLAWFLRSPQSLGWRYQAQQNAVGLRNLQTTEFLSQHVPAPPIATQRAVAAFLDELEEGNKGGSELPEELAEQRRTVARVMELAAKIHKALTLRGQAAEEAEALALAGTEQQFQLLKARYGTSDLDDICTTITDGDHNTPTFRDEGIRFIFVGNVSSSYLHFENCKRVSPEYFRSLKPQRLPIRGDILYSAVGATLGIPAVVDSDEPFCFQRHVAILKPDRHKLESRFCWHMLRSRTVFEKAWASTTGSAQPTIPLRAIRRLSIPVPPLPEQCRIATELDALQAEVDALIRLQTETAAELDAMLPAILDRAFKGEM